MTQKSFKNQNPHMQRKKVFRPHGLFPSAYLQLSHLKFHFRGPLDYIRLINLVHQQQCLSEKDMKSHHSPTSDTLNVILISQSQSKPPPLTSLPPCLFSFIYVFFTLNAKPIWRYIVLPDSMKSLFMLSNFTVFIYICVEFYKKVFSFYVCKIYCTSIQEARTILR